MAPATASAVAYGGGVAECAARAQSVRATLTRMRGVSSSVLDILGSMDSKFSELEATMRPIQSRTQALTRVHDNLEAACEVASDILEKFDKPRLLEPKLARGPGHSLQSLQLYLSRGREVQEAITFLESIQHFQSAEEVLRHARALLSTCTAKLEDTFRATLEQHLPKELPPSESSSAGGPALKPTRSQVHNANEQLLTQLSSLTVEEDEGNAKSPKGTPPAGKLAEAVEQPSSGGGVEYPEVAAEAVQRLQLMVAALVSLGQQKRCVVIYLQSRSTWVEQSMNALGAEGLRNPEEWSGVAVDWEALQERITLWLRFSVVMVRRLFVRELHLVQSIFVGSHAAEEPHDGQEGEQQQSRPPPLRPPHQVSRQRMEGIAGRAFDGTVAPCMALLQNFAQAVALGKLMPEKVFALLHMIDTVEELMLEALEQKTSQKSKVVELPLYPTEEILWDENLVPNMHYSGDKCLALPKLNLQFLTFHDYLLRNFQLFRLEATYEIREDIIDNAARLGPYENHMGELKFKGWARMCIPINAFTVAEVKKPRVGEVKPAAVTAELAFTTQTISPDIKQEWDSLKQHDIVFLLCLRAPLDVLDEDNNKDASEDVPPKVAADRAGIVYVRGAEVIEMRDSAGKLMNDFSGRIFAGTC